MVANVTAISGCCGACATATNIHHRSSRSSPAQHRGGSQGWSSSTSVYESICVSVILFNWQHQPPSKGVLSITFIIEITVAQRHGHAVRALPALGVLMHRKHAP